MEHKFQYVEQMKANVINSIIKATDILKSLADGIERISDLSKKLNLNKSTVHRFLNSLELSGMVTRDPITRRYYLGPLILNLASHPIISHKNLIVCAFEDMRYLRDLTHETVLLHIRIGLERICLEELVSYENIRYSAGKGFATPIYVGSAGKILLSELEDKEVQSLLENIKLISVSPHSINDKKTLLKELIKARRQGYATSFGERVTGSASISVPVKNYICPVSLSVLGPDNRFTLKTMMRFLGEIKESANNISNKLLKVT